MTALILPVLCALLVPCSAFAGAESVYAVDISNALNFAIASFFAIASAVAAWVIGKVSAVFQKKAGIEIDDRTRAYLLTAVESGIAWAKAKVDDKAEGYSEVEFKSKVVADAVRYVMDMVPDAVAHFDLTPGHITQLVESRLATDSK